MRYLLADDILEIHSFIIDETGGSHGVRDRGALLALEGLPRQSVFGKELYPDIFTKAAMYSRNIIFTHPFIDGNKRIGITTSIIFLEDNGYKFYAPNGAVEKFALKIVTEKLELEEIALWLKRHSEKTQKGQGRKKKE